MKPSASIESSEHWPYLASSALLTSFEMDKLRPLGRGEPDVGQVASMLVSHAEPVRSGPARGRWRLRDDVRRRVLTVLGTKEKLRAALDANLPEFLHQPTEQGLVELLESPHPRIEGRTIEELLGLQRAAEWLTAAGIQNVVPKEQICRSIARERLLEPLRRLVIGFEGREEEQTVLRKHVDHLPSETFFESLTRGALRLRDHFRHRPLLLIHGPGGAGKSTLVARFILDHAGAEQKRPMAFLLLDFDRNVLDPARPDTLLAECSEQLRRQFPQYATQLLGLEVELATRLGSENEFDQAQSAHFDASDRVRSMLASLLRDITGSTGENALLVIDTFEVVQRRGPTAVYTLLSFVADLLSHVHRLRVVVVGRGELRKEDFPFTDDIPEWKLLPLQGFGPVAGRAYLRSRLAGLHLRATDEDLDRIVQRVRGNPLGLRLAAQVFAREGVAGVEAAIDPAALHDAIAEEQVQGMLHARIVEHLENEDLKRIASPGLIVRRITAEVIRDVLAEPCGLSLEANAAEQLFDLLEREVSLVERAGDGALRHRTDVRLIMLPSLRRQLGLAARQIDDAAVHFWQAIEGPAARADELYHRMWRHDATEELDARWMEEASPYLEDALDEFQTIAPEDRTHIWLCERLGRELPEALRRSADQISWERDVAQKADTLIRDGKLGDALRLLHERPPETREPTSSLWLSHVDILFLLGRTDEAIALLQKLLGRSAERGDTRFHIDLLTRLAFGHERSARLDEAVKAIQQAYLLARDLPKADRALAAGVSLCRIARKAGTSANEVRPHVQELLQDPILRSAVFRDRPSVLRESAAEFGTDMPVLLAEALERLGLELSDSAMKSVTVPKALSAFMALARNLQHEQAALKEGSPAAVLQSLSVTVATRIRTHTVDRKMLEQLAGIYERAVERYVRQVRGERSQLQS